MKKFIAIFVIFSFIAAFADNPHITQLIELVDVAISSPANGDVLTFDSASAKWVNKPAAAPAHGPVIVAQQSFLNQTVDMPRTPIFTPPTAGIYRVSAYFEVVPQTVNTCTNLEVIWVDDQNVFHGLQGNPTCSDHSTVSATVYSVAGAPFMVDTQSSNLSGNVFNVFVTVEKL